MMSNWFFFFFHCPPQIGNKKCNFSGNCVAKSPNELSWCAPHTYFNSQNILFKIINLLVFEKITHIKRQHFRGMPSERICFSQPNKFQNISAEHTQSGIRKKNNKKPTTAKKLAHRTEKGNQQYNVLQTNFSVQTDMNT